MVEMLKVKTSPSTLWVRPTETENKSKVQMAKNEIKDESACVIFVLLFRFSMTHAQPYNYGKFLELSSKSEPLYLLTPC